MLVFLKDLVYVHHAVSIFWTNILFLKQIFFCMVVLGFFSIYQQKRKFGFENVKTLKFICISPPSEAE